MKDLITHPQFVEMRMKNRKNTNTVKNILARIVRKCVKIKTSQVRVIWSQLYNATATRSLYICGVKICDIEHRKATYKDLDGYLACKI